MTSVIHRLPLLCTGMIQGSEAIRSTIKFFRIHTPTILFTFRTPISYTSCAPDSPTSYHNLLPNVSIEMPALDSLGAHKPLVSTVNGNTLNSSTILLEVPSSNTTKCLSPIRELPTPIPSPALTPIMSRPQKFTQFAHSPISSSFNDRTNISSDDECMAFKYSKASQA